MNVISTRRITAAGVAATTALLGAVVAASPATAAGTPGLVVGWGTDGKVSAILPVGNKVYIGGLFNNVVDTAGVSHPAVNVAEFDPATGTFDLTFTGSTNAEVTSLASDGTNLFLGGDFTTVSGVARSRIASISMATGAANTAFKANANKIVDGLAFGGGALFAAGNFGTVNNGGTAVTQAKLTKLNPVTGAIDTTFRASADARVRGIVLAPDASKLYMAGDFRAINGATNQVYVSSVSATTGAVSAGFVPGNTSGYGQQNCLGLALSPAGDRIFTAGAGYQGGVASMDAVTGRTSWTKTADGNVQAITVQNNMIWVGGHFTDSSGGGISGTPRNKIANLDLATGRVLDWSARINSALGVWSMATAGNRVYFGGDFTLIDGNTVNHFAAITDGTVQTVPSAPLSAVATGGDAQVTLTWGLPSNDGGAALARYNVYRSTAGGAFSLIGTAGAGRSYVDTTVTNDVTYSYQVSATNAIGEGQLSAVVTATPKAFVHVAATAPRTLAAATTPTATTLTWVAPADMGTDPLQEYRIYRDGVQVGTSGALTWTDSAVTRGGSYTYSVTAVTGAGESAESNAVTATNTSTIASAPRSLTGTAVRTTGTLAWQAPASMGTDPLQTYRVYRDGALIGTATGTTYTDSTIVAGGTYTWTVTAVTAAGESVASNALTLTAVNATAPSAPVATRSYPWPTATISWTAPADGGSPITSYQVLRNGAVVANVSATTRSWSTISWFGGFTLSVRAINAIGTGATSNVLSY